MSSHRSKKASSQARRDLWELAQSAVQRSSQPSTQQMSRHVIVVGDARSGKSTLISAFLNPNKDSAQKPTIAIDYNFARKINSQTGQKEVARIWELGGDLTDDELLKVPLSAKNILTSSVVIVCDLSNPGSIVESLNTKLNIVRHVCDENIRHLRQSNPAQYEDLMTARGSFALSDEHPDKQQVDPFPIPAMIVGTKYDVFKDVESARRRILLQVIRIIAHLNGATFACSSSTEKAARDLVRAQLAVLSFQTQIRPVFQVEIEKPVAVQWGKDSFDKILQHSIPGVDASMLLHRSGSTSRIVQTLSNAVHEVYGHHSAQRESKAREDELELENQNDTEDQLRFADAIIDEARAQKALELAQFQELQSRHRKQMRATRSEAS